MSSIAAWSKTADDNDANPPNGWPEGQAPSTVNNCAREMMASIRTWYEDPIWIDYGTAVSYVAGTQFRVQGDLSSFYNESRRVKVFGTDDATAYGTITDTSFATGVGTTVTVDFDDGTSLNASVTQAWYSAIDPINNPMPEGVIRDKNLVVAGDFTTAPWQQGDAFTATTTDATYYVDNWILLSDGDGVVDIERHTDKALKFTVETGSKKFGMIQWFENAKTIPLVDFGKVSAMIEMKSDAALNIRVGIVKSTGTADTSVVAEAVSTWNAAGTDPTLVAGYAYENTPSDLALTAGGSYKTFKIENVDVSSDANNLGIFFWCDTLPSAADILYIKRIKLQASAHATYFDVITPEMALSDSKRSYEKSYAASVSPDSTTSAGAVSLLYPQADTKIYDLNVQFSQEKFRTPTITWYSTDGSGPNLIKTVTFNNNYTVSSTIATGTTRTGYPQLSSATQQANEALEAHWVADARLGSS